MHAILVPHADDELLFCYPALPGCTLLGVLMDAGFTRSMECRVYHRDEREVWLRRIPEMLPAAPFWDAPVPPVQDDELWQGCALFWGQCRALSIDQIMIPGRLDEYPHPHHRQLVEWADSFPGLERIAEQRGTLPEASIPGWRQTVLDTYRSERGGFQHAPDVARLLAGGLFGYIAYEVIP